jgi:hypothetical protein
METDPQALPEKRQTMKKLFAILAAGLLLAGPRY